MAGPTTTVLADDLKQLTKEVAAFRVEFADFRGRMENIVGFLKWFGALFAMTVVGGGVTLIWNASKLDSKVTTQGEKLAQIEGALAKITPSVAAQGERLDRIDRSLEKTAATVAAQGERLVQLERVMEQSNQRMDRLERAMEQSNQRLDRIEKTLERIAEKIGTG